MDSQDKVLDKSRELWDEFMNIPKNELHPDDTNDFRFHLHALQNIMYAQKYLKTKATTFEINGNDLIGVIKNTTNRNDAV